MTVYRCKNCGETTQPIPPMKREPLKDGDRVAFYDDYGRHTATVASAIADYLGRILVMPDQGNQKLVHLKQCRKLRKRKRREVYLKYSDGSKQWVECKHTDTQFHLEHGYGCVLFREVVRPVRK